MDLTPFLVNLEGNTFDEVLLSVAVKGKVAIAMKGRFLLRAICESISDRRLIGCAITDEASCLAYLRREPYELLICTDHLEGGNGYVIMANSDDANPLIFVELPMRIREAYGWK